MANKLVAVFVVCIVVIAALQLPAAQAHEDQFKHCFSKCVEDCRKGDDGETNCEIKCDGDCDAKEAMAKLDSEKD
ncbi:hypothetical protein L6164_034525 [Bauhinia variegata]|uniref:Uncharacterized protein n=1 Tax=Bauhinia variegata TaxID=167791 RepID=A0ACB9KWK0_BAUVA|nr:hypothetical protein L6164_034525 [Bauhinia variegata]